MDEKVSASIGKVARAESARIANGTKYWRDMGAVSETLTRLSAKELSKDGGEAAFGTRCEELNWKFDWFCVNRFSRFYDMV